MGVDLVSLHNALILRDSDINGRWYDAWGNGVVKHLEDFVTWPKDDTTGDPTEWKYTPTEDGTGDSLAIITDKAGGELLITTAANDNDGVNMQLGATAGENVKLDGENKLYFGIRFAISDATQSDVFFGVGVTDTDWSGGITDGLYFRKPDSSTAVSLVMEKDSVESVTTLATLTAAVYVTLEVIYDGNTVKAYVDGQEKCSLSKNVVTFPDNEELRLTLEFLAGEAAAKTMSVSWLRMIHLR